MTEEVKAKKKPFTPRKENCPSCYAEGKPDAQLDYRPGNFSYFCPNGHSFADLDELKAAIMEMNTKRNPPKVDPPAPPAAEAPKQEGMAINAIDHIRLQDLLKVDITDSSVLCGAVWSLRQEFTETKQALDSLKLSSIPDAKTGGDIKIQIRIPEVYVVPLSDVAEANGLTMEQHMQSMIEDGLSNNWYS